MRLHPLPTLAVIGSAVLALAITFTPPAAIPRYTQVTPPQDSMVACIPHGPGDVYFDGEELTVVSGGEEATVEGEPRILQGVEQPVTIRGLGPSGSVVGEDSLVSPCQPPATSGAVAFPSVAGAQLTLTNVDANAAAVDLTVLGPDGEVAGLGTRDIQLAPGESRPVAVSVIAEDVEGPLTVLWQTSRGRVVAQGGTASGDQYVAPSTQEATTQVLPGVSEGGSALVVLSNPGVDRATANLTFHSPTSAYTPQGGEEVSIPPQSTVAVDVGQATAGDPGAVSVDADLPVVAALYTGSGSQRGVATAAEAELEIGAPVPSGATIQLTNPGTEDRTASVGINGETQEVAVAAGTTATLPVGDADADVEVTSTQPLVGAAVLPDGTGIVQFTNLNVAEVEPRDAELVPSLR